MERIHTPVDELIGHFDRVLRTLAGAPITTGRADPSAQIAESDLDEEQRKLSSRLMRVNHAGEVAAQALYQGQALTARDPKVQEKLLESAHEENDHLAWCRQRTETLGGRTSYLDPLWYAGSLAIGASAGLIGDKWSLGFLAETEHQVTRHIESHLERVPEQDDKTRAILEQMKTDEMHHATVAIEHGAAELPAPVKQAMTLVSKVMTRAAFWI